MEVSLLSSQIIPQTMSSDSVDLLSTSTHLLRDDGCCCCCSHHNTQLQGVASDGPAAGGSSSRWHPLGCAADQEAAAGVARDATASSSASSSCLLLRQFVSLPGTDGGQKVLRNAQQHPQQHLRSCRCQHSCSDFLDVAGRTASSRDDDDDDDNNGKARVSNDTDECASFERLTRYIPQPSTSVLPRSRSEFERLKQRHPPNYLDLLSCFGKRWTEETCPCVTPGQSSSKLIDPWSGESQPLSPYEVARVGGGRRTGYEVWKMEDLLNSRKVLLIATILVALFGALTGLLVGLTLLEQANSSGSQESACASDHVRCGDVGCVHIRFVCAGLQWQCPDLLSQLECPNNQSESKMADEIWEELEREVSQEDYITVISEQEKPVRDAAGWVVFSKGSSSGSKYLVVHKSMTFYGAQDQCRKHGGYLAHVNTPREQIFLEEFLRDELKIDEYPSDGIGFWIGARRPRGGHGGTCMYDQWKWVDAYGRSHGSIAGFTAFIPGKPDNYYGPEECLYMTYKEGNDEERFLKWDDAPCDLNSIGSIKSVCEVELM